MGADGSAGFSLSCFWLWGRSGVGFSVPVYLFFLLFQLHYFQRSFVFPFLLKGKSRMPVAIMAMGIVFNVLNGMMQAGGLFYFAPEGAVCRWLGLFAETSRLAGSAAVLCRHVHKSSFRSRDTPSAQAGRHEALSSGKRSLPLCHFGQLFR